MRKYDGSYTGDRDSGEAGSIQAPVFLSHAVLFLHDLVSVGQSAMDVSIGILQSNLTRCGIHRSKGEPIGNLFYKKNLEHRHQTRAYLFLELQMINAPMMPGTQPRMVSTVTIAMDPQPSSRTASGGKRMQSTTRQQLIVLSCYSRNVILAFIRNDIRKPSPNGNGLQPFSLPLYSRLSVPPNANSEKNSIV
jgi:hypothetical protein